MDGLACCPRRDDAGVTLDDALGFRALKFSANAALGKNLASAIAPTILRDEGRAGKGSSKSLDGSQGINMVFSIAFFYLQRTSSYCCWLMTELKKVNPAFRSAVPIQSGRWADPDCDVPAICLGRPAGGSGHPRRV